MKVFEIIRILIDKNKRYDYFEKKRLDRMPRFSKTESTFLNKRIKITDAKSYLVGINEIFNKKNYEFKCSNDTPNIIDAGANIGLAIIYFKQCYPNAKITAFEPDPIIFSALMYNVSERKYNNVELHQKAIWDKETVLNFKSEGGFSGRVANDGDTGSIVKVNTIPLKRYLKGKIDFLKIDIEGAEFKVLLDCKDSLNNVENIFIEYHSDFHEKQKLHQILEILQSANFRYHVKEAYTVEKPFCEHILQAGMDLQLDIFGYRI